MGKIFEALKKSKKERNTTVPASETPDTTSFKKVAVLNKDNKPFTFSHKAPDNAKDDKYKKSTTSFKASKALYDDNNIDKHLVSLLNPQSFEAEQFKLLRTNLLFPVSGKPARSVMVTSAVPGEGKSFVAANLAISIAQNIQEHVLLIDCDMRLPCLHTRFGFGDVPGLSEHLSNDMPLSSMLLKTKVDKMSILPGGKPPHNPSELLSSQQMSKLFKEVKDRYIDRYIVIDTPPPKLTAEAKVIARQVDGIILVVRYGSTNREAVKDLIKIIGKEKILGVILNRFDTLSSSYYGYKKYGKYGKYYGKY